MPVFYLSFLMIVFSHVSFAFPSKPFVQNENKNHKVKLYPVWAINTISSKSLKPAVVHGSSPLLTKKFVIQSNGWEGIQVFTKKTGRMIWSFKIEEGSFSPLTLYQGNLYFGASDGFFYSLDIKTGNLVWKFFTGSENLSKATIDKGMIYWTASNQKLYALTLKGALSWVYAGPSLTRSMVLRSRPQPVVYKNFVYVGFYDGTLLALNKGNGRLQWKKTLSSNLPISGDLSVTGNCLFASVFQSKTYCLNPWNGAVRWSNKGSGILFPQGSLFYQWSENELMAFKKSNRKKVWSKKVESYPIKPVVYKGYLIYGSTSDGRIYVLNKKTSAELGSYLFGRGLSAPVKVSNKESAIYFFSVNAYLHKLRLRSL